MVPSGDAAYCNQLINPHLTLPDSFLGNTILFSGDYEGMIRSNVKHKNIKRQSADLNS